MLMDNKNKHTYPIFAIYRGIICLEMKGYGSSIRLWDCGFGLNYFPCHIDKIQSTSLRRLTNGRKILATYVVGYGWVAINLPRSDVPALPNKGLVPKEIKLPYTAVKEYSKLPEKIKLP